MVNKFKNLDQHFLQNEIILKKIIISAELNSTDVVLEIGPGKGVLTTELSKRVKRVIAIELDKNLKLYLDKLPQSVKVVYGNALKLLASFKFNKIISNIPYSISEPLFKKLLKIKFDLAVFLIGKKFYSLHFKNSKWAIINPLFFEIRKIIDVPKEAFIPKPRVSSVLISLKPRTRSLSKIEKITKEFVLQDDKKVKNALIFSLKRIENLTKKQAKKKISGLKVPVKTLEKIVDNLSNGEFSLIYHEILEKFS